MRRSSGTGYIIGLFLMEEKLRNWLLYLASFNWGEVRNWLYNGVTSYGGESQELVIQYNGVTSYGGESQELSSKRGEKTVSSISSRRPNFKEQSEEQVDIWGGSACLKHKANFCGAEAQKLSGEYCTFNFIGEKLRVSLEKRVNSTVIH
jgi:hypothetical protein